jgi:ABC-type transport system substrate-binding protein
LTAGVTFHDGSPLTAEDVVWTFERLADPDLGGPTSDLYSNIERIEATGELEVTFTLIEPNPFFLYDLSDNHPWCSRPAPATRLPPSTAADRSRWRSTVRALA